MTARWHPIIDWSSGPDQTGNVFIEKYKITDTAADLNPDVLVFANAGTVNDFEGSFIVPSNYVDTANLETVWTSILTSGTLRLEWVVLTRSGVEDMGAVATRTTEGQTDTKSGTAFARQTTIISLTDTDYVAGDTVLYRLSRDVATDTMAGKALCFKSLFTYDDGVA